MKAIQFHQYGSSDVLKLEDITIPSIADDEILIRVRATSINPVDWKIREGMLTNLINYTFPVVLGWDVAGDVTAIGSKVKKFKKDDAVFGYLDVTRQGTYAEYVVAKESELALIPAGLDYVKAAALPIAAITAWQVLFDVANLEKGQSILIHAGAGGVGHMAVQLAKAQGAYVIATASEKNKSFLESLGVDQFIDYHNQPFEKVVKDVDIVIDSIGDSVQEKSFNVLKKNGLLVSIVLSDNLETYAKKYGIQAKFYGATPNGEQLQKIGDLYLAGKIHPHVSKVFPLSQVKEAHEMSQSGRTVGKIVLTI